MKKILRYLLVLMLLPSLALAQNTDKKKNTKDGDKLIPISREQAERLVTAIVTAQMENETKASALDRKILDVKMDALKRQMLDNALRKAYTSETNERLARLENLMLLSLMNNGTVDPSLLQSYLAGKNPGQTIISTQPYAQNLTPEQQTPPVCNTQDNNSRMLNNRSCNNKIVGQDAHGADTVIYLTNETIESFHYQVFFDFDSSVLSAKAQQTLASVIELMKKNPELKIRLQGYASPEGNLKYNNKLSARRVNACADYIANAGVQRSRLEVSPAGIDSIKDTYPEARRVDIKPIICE